LLPNREEIGQQVAAIDQGIKDAINLTAEDLYQRIVVSLSSEVQSCCKSLQAKDQSSQRLQRSIAGNALQC